MARLDRVFLDANVLFSASYAPESGLKRLWTLKDIELVTSAYAIGEVRRNLDSQQQIAMEELLSSVRLFPDVVPVEAVPVPEPGLPDKDLPILLAAQNAEATHLLTGDFKHFGPHYGTLVGCVQVLPPAAYLESYSDCSGED